MSVRVLIVDDERPARGKIRAHLREWPDIEIVGEADNGLQAVDAIRTTQPDLVFLDIQMPGLNGFEVIASIGADAMPSTIFVTAYDEFALKAFEVEAVDYILKPYDAERFSVALDRALRRLSSSTLEVQSPARLLERVLPGDPYLRRIVVREGGRLFFVEVSDLLHISSEENYVLLHTAEGSHMLRETLEHLSSRLDPCRFARVNRSSIANIEKIQELEPWSHGDYRIRMKDGTILKLSRRFQHNFLERFR